jgi:hypothetical protein
VVMRQHNIFCLYVVSGVVRRAVEYFSNFIYLLVFVKQTDTVVHDVGTTASPRRSSLVSRPVGV